MAYNGFNYSPYFDHRAQQEGRYQSSHQDSSEGAGSYQRHSYQPNTTSAAPSPQYAPAQSSAERIPNTYSRFTPGGNNSSTYQPVRAESQGHPDPGRMHPYSNARSSIDTTALGSLAYASSLGQEPRSNTSPARYGSMQHIVDYNRSSQPVTSSAASAVYGVTSTASNGHDYPRSDGHGASSAREGYRPPDTQSPYSASHSHTASSYGGYTNSYARSSTKDSSDPRTTRFSPASQQPSPNPITNSQRPASGQSNHIPTTRPIPKSSQPNDHRPTQSPVYPAGSSHKASNQSQDFQAAKGCQFTKPTTSQPQGAILENLRVTQGRLADTEQDSRSYMRIPPPDQLLKDQPQTTENRTINPDTHHPRETEIENPTTVDPSRIFNHYEYERRQATAEAARKTAEEAVAKKAEAATPPVAAASVAAPAPVVTEENSPANRKDQMELEMKQMIEKMRDYKAKDPTLFSQIWEQVKKGQPANRSTSQAPSSAPNGKETAAAELNEQAQLPSPNPTHVQLPLESELSIKPLEGKEPDLGKFPSQRRRTRKSIVSTAETRTRTADPSGSINKTTSPSVGSTGVIVQKTVESSNQSPVPQPASVQQTQLPRQTVYTKGVGPAKPPKLTGVGPDKLPNLPGVGPANPPNPSGVEPDKPPNLSASHQAPKGGTIWPQGNKRALAEAARAALTSGGLNASRAISVDEIVTLLNQNPSYTELCESLERKGFIIDRGHFARILLSAVAKTDQTSGQQTSDTDPQVRAQGSNTDPLGRANGFNGLMGRLAPGAFKPFNPIDHNQIRRVGNAKSHLSLGNRQHQRFGMLVKTPTHAHGLPSASEVLSRSAPNRNKQNSSRPVPNNTQQIMSYSAPNSNKKTLASHGHPINGEQRSTQPQTMLPSLPPSKKEMARKRSFADIVDLTQELSDEEDAYQQAQRARLSMSGIWIAPKPRTFNKVVEPDVAPDNSLKSHAEEKRHRKSHMTNAEGGPRSELNSAPVTDDEYLDLSKFKYAPSQRNLLRSETIIRPMNKRNDALRRDNYNAKTIARDILVASGKHLTMAPLNHHLEILKKRFHHVDNNSDLSTFRWDLVDPGGPTNAGDLGEQAPDHDMNDADDEGAAYEEDDHDDQSLLPQQVQVDSTSDGDHANITDVNTRQPIKGFPALRKWKASRPSETTIRSTDGDGVQEGLEKPKTSSYAKDVFMGLGSGLSNEGAMSFLQTPPRVTRNEDVDPRESQTPSSKPRGRPSGSGKKRGNGRTESETPSQLTEPKRRGRPLGRKDTSPRKLPASRKPKPDIPTRPRSSTGPKKPSNLRHTITPSDGIAVVINSRPFSSFQPRMQDKTDKTAPREANAFRQSIKHKVYKCLWKDCPYELHNLQTLRKHVYKHREKCADGLFRCSWARCGTINLSGDETDESEDELIRLEFRIDSAWEKHMDAQHLDKLAWEMGDGQATPASGTFGTI